MFIWMNADNFVCLSDAMEVTPEAPVNPTSQPPVEGEDQYVDTQAIPSFITSVGFAVHYEMAGNR